MSNATEVTIDSNLEETKKPVSVEEVKIFPVLILFSIGICLWQFPPPTGLNIEAWHLFIIFVLTIVGIILKPLPIGGLTIIALSICTLTRTLTIEQTLSSFSSKTVWLVVCAFLLARGFIKTGLGTRIAYYFMSVLGKNTLGLAYGFCLTELLLAPAIPSNTARGAGVVYPIVQALNQEYDSSPEKGTSRKIGAYLIQICYQANIITSGMFLTAMAANPLIASFALATTGIELTWLTWAMLAIVPGLCCLFVLPIVLFYLYPPEIKQTPKAKELAKDQLKKMGSLSKNEILMLVTFVLLITLWVFGAEFNIEPTAAALMGLGLLLISGVLTWEDVLNEKNAWNAFIWLAALLVMAKYLTEFGFISWYSDHIKNLLGSHDPLLTLILVVVVYFYSHYFFASMTAHVTAMYSAFLVVATLSGVPPVIAAILLGVTSSLSASITHYGTGTAPVYFGTNYVSIGDWWKLGALISVVNLLIWFVVGNIWWSFLGAW